MWLVKCRSCSKEYVYQGSLKTRIRDQHSSDRASIDKLRGTTGAKFSRWSLTRWSTTKLRRWPARSRKPWTAIARRSTPRIPSHSVRMYKPIPSCYSTPTEGHRTAYSRIQRTPVSSTQPPTPSSTAGATKNTPVTGTTRLLGLEFSSQPMKPLV